MSVIAEFTADGTAFAVGRALAVTSGTTVDIERVVPIEDGLFPYCRVRGESDPAVFADALAAQSGVDAGEGVRERQGGQIPPQVTELGEQCENDDDDIGGVTERGDDTEVVAHFRRSATVSRSLNGSCAAESPPPTMSISAYSPSVESQMTSIARMAHPPESWVNAPSVMTVPYSKTRYGPQPRACPRRIRARTYRFNSASNAGFFTVTSDCILDWRDGHASNCSRLCGVRDVDAATHTVNTRINDVVSGLIASGEVVEYLAVRVRGETGLIE